MYVVLIGLLIVVFSSFLPKASSGSKTSSSPEVMNELEETMEGFLAELEEDNQKLIGTMASMKAEHEAAVKRLTDKLDHLEKEVQDIRQGWNRMALERVERREAELLEKTLSLQTPAAPLVPAAVAGSRNAAPLHEPVPSTEAHEPGKENGDTTIRHRYQELFRMHGEGKSVEYIAKKSGMNKGEVSLILQLAEQEERKGAEK